MLPAASRMRRSTDFAATVRRGPGTARSARRTLVVHLAVGPPHDAGSDTQAGLVVSKAVGPAVVRTQVKRRLRHLLRDRLAGLPSGARLVVRALPPAAVAPSTVLGEELDEALSGALRTLERAGSRR